jgi:hypothetical protein
MTTSPSYCAASVHLEEIVGREKRPLRLTSRADRGSPFAEGAFGRPRARTAHISSRRVGSWPDDRSRGEVAANCPGSGRTTGPSFPLRCPAPPQRTGREVLPHPAHRHRSPRCMRRLLPHRPNEAMGPEPVEPPFVEVHDIHQWRVHVIHHWAPGVSNPSRLLSWGVGDR